MKTQQQQYKFINSSLYKFSSSLNAWVHVWAGVASNLKDAVKKYHREY